MEIIVTKTLSGHLVPCNAGEADKLKRVKAGEDIVLTFRKPRNVQFHRKFFALINMVFQNQDLYDDPDMFLDLLKIGVGHCWVVETKSGDKLRIPRSISFASMDDVAFEKFYNRVVDFILAHVIHGWSKPELEAAVLEFDRK